MSWKPANEPECDTAAQEAVALTIAPRARDVGGFDVRRVLPSIQRRRVGPFLFFDHFGPAEIPAGTGMDVRPHPHLHLATVTYLFEGAVVHRDSLGSHQVIAPGAINWMHAGRGIVHSERSRDEDRGRTTRSHGVQIWVGLPEEHEDTDPEFHHHPAATLPEVTRDGVRLKVLVGTAYGVTSPVATRSPMVYVDAVLSGGASLSLPTDVPERAVYAVEGAITVNGRPFEPRQMLVLAEGAEVTLEAPEGARVLLIGGDPMGQRHMWWNFVSSDKANIEQAKQDWKARRFASIPGDDDEFIPLPE